MEIGIIKVQQFVVFTLHYSIHNLCISITEYLETYACKVEAFVSA